MKKKAFYSCLLSMMMIISGFELFLPVMASDDNQNTTDYDSVTETSGMHVSKTATANSDGTYTIQLEAYATGNKVISEIKQDKPCDIVLVLDQSGSMTSKNMSSVSFEEYTSNITNNDHYSRRHNGGSENLWYQLDDGSYVSVNISIDENTIDSHHSVYSGTNAGYKAAADNGNLYIKNNDGTYSLVSVLSYPNMQGTKYYYYVDNNYLGEGSYNWWNQTDTPPSLTFYQLTEDFSKAQYTYYYLINGQQTIITTSIGKDTNCESKFYKRSTSTITRLEGLKKAATSFVDSVIDKSYGKNGIDDNGTGDDVKHRIAVIGFAHGTDNTKNFVTTNGEYLNTEVFIGSKQYKYGESAESVYDSAYQDLTTDEGKKNVRASINALDSNGATQIDLGMEMAKGVLDANPVDSNERNQIVIVITDGYPSSFSDYSSKIANNAIATSAAIKKNKVTVYAIGVFDEADDQSEGNQYGNDTDKVNWFLQNLSSNNGKVSDPSYYLSTTNTEELDEIFKQITKQINDGQSASTLNNEAVLQDIIAPQFVLPDPDDTQIDQITVESYRCTGQSNNVYTWEKNDTSLGANAKIDGDKVTVSGFNYSDNYVCPIVTNDVVTGYQGNKLVITFNVKPKDDFLGGNNVYTNDSAGIYEHADSELPVIEFKRPQVNVPIKKVSVTASDKNVYLLGSLTGEQLKEYSTVTCGSVDLKLGKDNYGLEEWQTAYIDITATICNSKDEIIIKYDSKGNPIPGTGSVFNLIDDTTYTIKVSITPKSNGVGASGTPATDQCNNPAAEGKINVYKPVVTFKDSDVFYGDIAPNDYKENYVNDKTVWKHNEACSTDPNVDMIGNKPELIFEYTPDSSKVINGIISSKEDVGVAVTPKIKIGNTENPISLENITINHDNCGGNTCNKGEFDFLLHVHTGSLTIRKVGGEDGEPYVFTVYKRSGEDLIKYTEASITFDADATGTDANLVTIHELPVGKYTVIEDTDWSWRYENSETNNGPVYVYDNSNEEGVISPKKPSISVEVTNTKNFKYWLNGFSTVVQNIFRKATN